MRLIVTAMKTEGPFIPEWAAHHRAIGFDRFLVFTADRKDGTGVIRDRIAALGPAAHERNAEIRADAHPLRRAAARLIRLDVDEFIAGTQGEGRLDDRLSALPEADMIAPAWRRFGAAGRTRHDDAREPALTPLVARRWQAVRR